MSVIFIALPVALALAAAALLAFAWATRQGQFDDLDTPPLRMLFDDELPRGDQTGDEVMNRATDIQNRRQ